MVELGVLLVREDPGQHGSGIHRAAGNGGVDGVIDQRGGVLGAHEAAKGQVIVPGDHGEGAVLLVEVVVVDHGAGVAVEVAHEVVHHEVTDHLVHVQDLLQVLLFVQLAQGVDQPILIRVGDVGLGVVKDVGIAVHVVGVDQGHVVGAEAPEAPEAKAPEAAREVLPGLGEAFAALPEQQPGQLGHVRVAQEVLQAGGLVQGLVHGLRVLIAQRLGQLLRRVRLQGFQQGLHLVQIQDGLQAAAHLPHVRHLSHVRHFPRELEGGLVLAALLGLLELLLPAFHVEVAAVAPAAAHVDAVRLIELAVIVPVVALEEGLLHALHRQVQPEVLAVDRDVDEATQGRVGAEGVHHLVAEVVLHVGVVLDEVVEAELIQPVVADSVIVMIELDLKAVAVVAVGGHLGQGGVALGPDGHVAVGFLVDDHGAKGVLLRGAGFQEAFPIVHPDVDGVHGACVKQPGLIAHGSGGGLNAQAFGVHEQHGDDQRGRQDEVANSIDGLVRGHGWHLRLSPYSRRCS